MPKDQSGKTEKNKARSDVFTHIARQVASTSGHASVFLCAVLIITVWALTGPFFKFNDTWQLVINTGTTIVTFLMVFLIQNTQNRDSEAVQLKLDEIIRALDQAENNVMDLEEKSQEELDEIKGTYTQLAHEAADEIKDRKAS